VGRLYVIPARNEPVALILRRGPSDWYHLIQWETRRDVFTHGAWIRGRIYEERCDLSPDGKLFIYFVRATPSDPSYTHAWTAVSRVPWLFALTLWPQGTTYFGGGTFVENRIITLGGVFHPPHPLHPLKGLSIVESEMTPRLTCDQVEEADWSGRDQRGNLIFSKKDKLFRRVKRKDLELADFHGIKPDPQPAPAWARRSLAQ